MIDGKDDNKEGKNRIGFLITPISKMVTLSGIVLIVLLAAGYIPANTASTMTTITATTAAYAQKSNASDSSSASRTTDAEGPTNNNDLRLNTTKTDIPVLEKISDKGIYRVQLKWNQQGVTADQGMDVEIVFLNATAPKPTAETVPQLETNSSGFSGEGDTGFNTPSIIQPTLAVDSYDMAVYSNNGEELWKETGLVAAAGRGAEKITFTNTNYTGPITIQISNIKPGWLGADTTSILSSNDTTVSGNRDDLVDSVTFTATVVPEFPALVMLPLVIGIAAVLSIFRIKIHR